MTRVWSSGLLDPQPNLNPRELEELVHICLRRARTESASAVKSHPSAPRSMPLGSSQQGSTSRSIETSQMKHDAFETFRGINLRSSVGFTRPQK